MFSLPETRDALKHASTCVRGQAFHPGPGTLGRFRLRMIDKNGDLGLPPEAPSTDRTAETDSSSDESRRHRRV